jgi:hypothetical protein
VANEFDDTLSLIDATSITAVATVRVGHDAAFFLWWQVNAFS